LDNSDLLSIKEFAEFAGIKQSALRYYDEIGVFSPASRGENNYRYYSPIQITTIKLINVLTELGIPLSQIKEMGKGRTPKRAMELLAQQEQNLDTQLLQLQAAYAVIHAFRSNIQNGLLAGEQEITLQEMAQQPMVLGPENDFGDDKYFFKTFIRFCNSAQYSRINLNFPVGGYFSTLESFLQSPSRPTNFYSQDPGGTFKKAAGKYLVGYTRGYYGQFGNLPERMLAYAGEHNLVCHGPVYEIYLLDEISISDTDQYLSQISIPVSCAKVIK
jgi:DNA-binding transcriptional MerR regulator